MARTEYLDIRTAAVRMKVTGRHVRRMCEAGKLRGAVRDGRRWKIPVTADARLWQPTGPKKLSDSDELLEVPEPKRRKALWRLGVIQQWKSFSAQTDEEGMSRLAAQKMFAAATEGVTEPTLRRWLCAYRHEGLLGLVDKRGGGRTIAEMISPEAFELFKSMYLAPQQLSVRTCWLNVKYVNSVQSKDWRVPPLRSMYRYAIEQIPLPARILHREGLAAYEAKCAPYVQSDPDTIQPGQVWVGDHHQLNVWIRNKQRWVRPWITAWLDLRSRHVVGWHISTSPNQTTILLAMKRGLQAFGPPESVKIDNGRDYDSEMWTGTTKARRKALGAGYLDEQMIAGLYAMMDVTVGFAIPYHPQSKRIERWFDTLDMQFCKTLPTYCGKDSSRKPEGLADLLKSQQAIDDAYDLESFRELAGRYIDDVYNKTAHGAADMGGKSPARMMAERGSRRALAEGVVDLLMRVWSGEIKVGKNGVKFHGMWYGQYDMELHARQGQTVRLAYDPDDLRKVHVYDATTLKLITIAEQNQLIGYGDAVSEEQLRDAMKQKSRAVRITRQYRDSRLAAQMDLPSLTLKAMEEGAQEEPQEKPRHLKPVRTPMDSQVREHKRQEAKKALRRAAGAEGMEESLDIDWDCLRNDDNLYRDIDIFKQDE